MEWIDLCDLFPFSSALIVRLWLFWHCASLDHWTLCHRKYGTLLYHQTPRRNKNATKWINLRSVLAGDRKWLTFALRIIFFIVSLFHFNFYSVPWHFIEHVPRLVLGLSSHFPLPHFIFWVQALLWFKKKMFYMATHIYFLLCTWCVLYVTQ